MTPYLIFVLKRFGQFLLVVFLGVTITFFVTHLTPIDPVEESIGAITQMGQSDPNAIELMRQSLRELYGMQGSIWQQYLNFWLRLATGRSRPLALGPFRPLFRQSSCGRSPGRSD